MKSNSNQYKYLAITAFVGLVLVALGFGAFSEAESTHPIANNPVIPQVDFNFDVYCPITNSKELKIINDALGFSTKVFSFDFNIHKNVYVVIAKAEPEQASQPQSQGRLYYCGLTRKWADKNCNNAKLQCSIPGPMFYLPVKQETTVVFFNIINSSEVNWVKTDCYADDSDDQFCKVTSKQIKQGCSYPDPTDYSTWKTGRHRISNSSVPISVHIHGLETRPTFDGNPLAWHNTDGQTGPGFNTLLDSQYYSLFNDPSEVKSWLVIPDKLAKLTKVIKAPNNQLPGMLFYHDHAMKSTLYNVQNGFSGLYILYDEQVQETLPQGDFEKFVLFAKPGDARCFVSPSPIEGRGDVIEDGTYRIRMINAHFDNVYANVSYCAYYEAVTDDQGKTIYIQYDPTSSPQYDLTSHRHQIPFSVIGTDTTVFHKSVSDISQVTMGSAQRIDILINFQASLPPGIEYVYIICYDTNEGKIVMKHRFTLPWDSENLKVEENGRTQVLNLEKNSIESMQDVEDIVISEDKVLEASETKAYLTDPDFRKKVRIEVPFTDLSLIPDEQIAVKRHRPLFSLPFDEKFMIGAHYMFEMGRADNPQIGTIQDFYMVNTLWEPHPMHIHLINFQVVATYSLKSIPENEKCTLYMLDYFRLSQLPEVQLSNVELCDYLWNLNSTQVDNLFEKMGNYSLENVTINRISGLDSMAPFDGDSRYLVEGCQWNTVYKYVCSNTTDEIPAYQRRWKDTFLVPAYTVAIQRVRWASTGYDHAVKPYPYFEIPEDQLIEFPGFVYHCHILPHEDNEMMRPFVLQYSDEYLRRFDEFKRKGSCTGRSWLQTLNCINGKLGCSA